MVFESSIACAAEISVLLKDKPLKLATDAQEMFLLVKPPKGRK